MRTMARWLMVTVLALDAAFAVLFFTGGLPTIGAEPDENGTAGSSVTAVVAGDDGAQATPRWTRESLALLGERLEQRAAELERREREIEELVRGSEVLRQAGLLPAGAAADEEQPVAAEAEAPVESEDFARLRKAYENMEPESAAQALVELAARDQEAVVELLLGWQPRVSGAILDAVTQLKPALAADLSYEIWKRGGGQGSARSG